MIASAGLLLAISCSLRSRIERSEPPDFKAINTVLGIAGVAWCSQLGVECSPAIRRRDYFPESFAEAVQVPVGSQINLVIDDRRSRECFLAELGGVQDAPRFFGADDGESAFLVDHIDFAITANR